jgi:hypothetical protein
VGSEDFPWDVSEQELASNKRLSGKKRFATKAILPRRRKISFQKCRVRQAAHPALQCSELRGPINKTKRDFRFHVLMHFSAYLMIAALVIMGLQLAYAFYQLASFVL